MDPQGLSFDYRYYHIEMFPELVLLRKNLAHREYEVDIIEHLNSTLLILSREKNSLDAFAFKEIERCGFKFTEVLWENQRVKAIFERNEENRFPDLV